MRLKLAGLTDIDKSSLKSMLRLSSDLLTQEWLIVDEGQADLVIYSFDSEAGQQAWRQRESGFTALLTNTGNVTQPVDVVLRKPLRKTNFSEALNLIEEKIRLQQATDTPSAPPQKVAKKSEKLNKLLVTLKLRKRPASHLPLLDLAEIEQSSKQTDIIKEPKLLQAWINQLPREANQRVSTLLANLQSLCQFDLKPMTMLSLLEIYRTAVADLLFTRDISAVKRDIYFTTENLRAIRTTNELIAKLAVAYQQIIRFYYERGETPDNNKTLLLCLNRTTEMLALQILHSYQYYRSSPRGVWNRLHQLYLYQEKAGTLNEAVTLKELYNSRSFFDLYTQIILTGLADPYSLAKFDVFRLFGLMEQFTDKIELGLLSLKQINTTSNFMLTGHFCIDCAGDALPDPMIKTSSEIRTSDHARLLNTQPALLAIENIFRNAKNTSHASLDNELRLLKKIIPQLNTTHERRFHRLNTGKHRTIDIAHGINAVYQSLTNRLTHALPWQLANQSSGGLMAKRQTDGCYHLNIGDFIGIFEDEFQVKLATIKWLHIDIDGDTHIGLELIEGKPIPVVCTPDGEAEQHPSLIIPSDVPKTESTMITEKGLYSPKRKIRVKDDDEPYIIVANGMIDSTLDYEQFNYTIKTGS
ncbi:hypothetical protein [Methylophaga sp.]|uniref:hypothetical protein n=1 Tax=Methylophaga sp. TaxID=2024840 RepID=UPI003F699CDF